MTEPKGELATTVRLLLDRNVDLIVEHVSIVPRLMATTTEATADAGVRGVGVVRLLQYQVADAVRAAGGQMPLNMRRFLDFAAPRLRAALAASTSS